VLHLLPGTAISGPAGSTVGWGYTITNNTPNWVETLNLTADVFSDGSPLSIFDFPVVGPMSFVSLPYSQVISGTCTTPDCGLYEFAWDPGVATGTMNSGTFTINSEYFSSDPLTDPAAIDLGEAPNVTAAYSVAVSDASPGPVPEPSTFILLITAMGVFSAVRTTGLAVGCRRFAAGFFSSQNVDRANNIDSTAVRPLALYASARRQRDSDRIPVTVSARSNRSKFVAESVGGHGEE
jgi:hypothetical protein